MFIYVKHKNRMVLGNKQYNIHINFCDCAFPIPKTVSQDFIQEFLLEGMFLQSLYDN